MSLDLTNELIQDLANKYQFVVATKMGVEKVIITDMEAIWAIYPEVVLILDYRIVGLEDDITKVLFDSGFKEDDISDAFTKAITLSDVEEGSAEYEEELTSFSQWRTEVIQNYKEAESKDLLALLKVLNPNVKVEVAKPAARTATRPSGRPIGKVVTGKATTAKTPTKNSPGRNRKSLETKVKELAYGKIINVSKLVEKGETTTTKRAENPRLFTTPNLPFMSNNLESVLAAIEELRGNEIEDEDGNLMYDDDALDEDEDAANNYAWTGAKTKPPPSTTVKGKGPREIPQTGGKIAPISTSTTPQAVIPSATRRRRVAITEEMLDEAVKPIVDGIVSDEEPIKPIPSATRRRVMKNNEETVNPIVDEELPVEDTEEPIKPIPSATRRRVIRNNEETVKPIVEELPVEDTEEPVKVIPSARRRVIRNNEEIVKPIVEELPVEDNEEPIKVIPTIPTTTRKRISSGSQSEEQS